MYRILTALLIPSIVPTLVFAGAWTLPKGKTWTKITVLRQQTDEAYLASMTGVKHLSGLADNCFSRSVDGLCTPEMTYRHH